MRCDASGVTKADDVQGRPRPVPGQYLCIVKRSDDSRVRPDGKPFNATVVELEVLAGNVPGQEGKTVEHKLWLDKDTGAETPEYLQKALRLCLALGLIRPGEQKDIDFDSQAPGKICVVSFEETGKDGKKYTNVGNYGMDLWPVNDPAVAAIVNLPASQEVLRALGAAGSTAPAASAPAAPPANTAAASTDKYAGL